MENVTPRLILTWAIILAVFVFLVKYILPIFLVILIGLFGLFLALILIDTAAGGTSLDQTLDAIAAWITTNL